MPRPTTPVVLLALTRRVHRLRNYANAAKNSPLCAHVLRSNALKPRYSIDLNQMTDQSVFHEQTKARMV